MKQHGFLLFIILNFIHSYKGLCQHAIQEDTLHWEKNIPLKWKDYKGKATTGYQIALTSTFWQEFITEYNDSIVIKIITVFDGKSSWVLPFYVGDSILLTHEQGHFDISEVYARRFIKEISVRKWNKQKFKLDYENLYKRYNDSLENMQSKYDKETNYHMNKIVQIKWTKLIDMWIRELALYEPKRVVIYFNK